MGRGGGKGPRGAKVLGMQKVRVGKRPSDKIPGGGEGKSPITDINNVSIR